MALSMPATASTSAQPLAANGPSGDAGVNNLLRRTNSLTVSDGHIVSKSIVPSDGNYTAVDYPSSNANGGIQPGQDITTLAATEYVNSQQNATSPTNTFGRAMETEPRPELPSRASRSYIDKPQEPVTHYDRPLEEPVALSRRTSIASKRGDKGKAVAGVAGAGVGAALGSAAAHHHNREVPSRTTSTRNALHPNDHVADPSEISRPPSCGQPVFYEGRPDEYERVPRPKSAQPESLQSRNQRGVSGVGFTERPQSAAAGLFSHRHVDHEDPYDNPRVRRVSSYREGHLSPSQSVRNSRLPAIADDIVGPAPIALGQIATADHQHMLQGGEMRAQQTQGGEMHGHQLQDDGPVRPRSSFGRRPQPVYDRPDSRFAANERSDFMGRSNTVISRANTMGRNGTLSRAANGGTIGRRSGAFGRGAGLSVGTQPEEVLGRDDIHMRAEISERVLDQATLAKLSAMEKKDARKLAKLLKSEAREQGKAVQLGIRDLGRLTNLQKDAIKAERESQGRLTKWTSREHKARMRFLKEKERYEKIEGELRNAENDFEERRDHAAGLTAQIAERTQEMDDMRAQKAADDRERQVKLLALKNPAHS